MSQVAKLSGISIRTLQYYDEIGLLKPSASSMAGYRLYDDCDLEKLQQILFYKELGFKLKDINELIAQAYPDRIAAFKRQKELLLLRRNRTDGLIKLLERLEKGEQCMSFKEFDLSEYIQALELFKKNSKDDMIRYWGSENNFDLFINKVKDDEEQVAKLAIKQYGSIEKYTAEMKYNLEHFSEIMEQQWAEDKENTVQQSLDLYQKLIDQREKDVSSDEIQHTIQEIISFALNNSMDQLSERNFLELIIDTYSGDYIKAYTDTQYGQGASDYIVSAFRYTLENNIDKEK